MRWPIRNQILLPLAAIQISLVLTISLLAAWWSLRRVESEIRSRLDVLASTLQRGQFPLTSGVLEQMRGLSGAEFVILDQEGEWKLSTMDRGRSSVAQSDIPSQPKRAGAELIQLAGKRYLLRSVNSSRHPDPRTVWILMPETSILAARREAMLGPILLGIGTLFVTTIAVAFVAHRIGRRMQRIEEQVARVAGGDFRPIPLTERDDELRDLAESINRMCTGLDRMTSRIRETERTHLIKQLAAGIAHQLRNALTGARLAVQIHRGRCTHSTDESLDVALKQLALTEEQIRGLVALVRDEHRTPIAARISDVTKEIVLLLRPMCNHRQIGLNVRDHAEYAIVDDGDAVRAALLNLCMNAIEATGAGGDIEIVLSTEGNLAIIEVSDDGMGIPPEMAENLFDPFQTSKPDGMGLGLALVNQAARIHGGTVEHHRAAGRTVFRMTCACRCADGESESVVPVPPPRARLDDDDHYVGAYPEESIE